MQNLDYLKNFDLGYNQISKNHCNAKCIGSKDGTLEFQDEYFLHLVNYHTNTSRTILNDLEKVL